MSDRYGIPPPPPPPPPMSGRIDNDYSRGGHQVMRSPMAPPSRYRSPSPRRHRSRSPPRYRSRSRSPYPPRRNYVERKRAPAPVYRGTEEDRARSCTLFVGNLPYGFEERDVVGLFERFGRLRQVYVPIDRFTRRNKGFAFVSFEQRLDAEDAFFKYNGYLLEGRKLRIDWDVGIERKDHLRGPPAEGPSRSPRRERDFDDRRDRSPPPPRSSYNEYR